MVLHSKLGSYPTFEPSKRNDNNNNILLYAVACRTYFRPCDIFFYTYIPTIYHLLMIESLSILVLVFLRLFRLRLLSFNIVYK